MKKVILTLVAISFICGTVHPIIEDKMTIMMPLNSKQNFEEMITKLQGKESVAKQISKWVINNPAIVAGSTLATSIVLTPFLGVPITLAIYLALKSKSPYYQYKWAKDTFVELGKEYQKAFKNCLYDASENAFVAFGKQDPCLYLILYAQDIGEKIRLLDAAIATLANAQDYSYKNDEFFNDCVELSDALEQLKIRYFDQIKVIQAHELYVVQLKAYAEQQQAYYHQINRNQERQEESCERARDRQALMQALQVPAQGT